MSKMDNLRAMREARFAENAARASRSKATPADKPATKPPVAPPQAARAAAADLAPEADGLCGHRSMNGRTCTREAGHAAKSHRYS